MKRMSWKQIYTHCPRHSFVFFRKECGCHNFSSCFHLTSASRIISSTSSPVNCCPTFVITWRNSATLVKPLPSVSFYCLAIKDKTFGKLMAPFPSESDKITVVDVASGWISLQSWSTLFHLFGSNQIVDAKQDMNILLHKMTPFQFCQPHVSRWLQ